ncbi:hypothetical protein WR164_15210 [Philodulcilactobacillus myokoensis]|uniref:Nicotinamide mononucleotide transporter n=1 Tax=Philodulcilactobacillus myokoensis TaxID=2929573 RepID=A0A9W6ETQ2_9LACO|nr:nicotinamide riboside transporter PnuC [Philodulcilactobacillus myokoensis]GLB47542.1 hypothetical protein WR164_15210 [Philodulcilactobacillus myokoensis]
MNNNLSKLDVFSRGMKLTFSPKEIFSEIFRMKKSRSIYLWVLQLVEVASFLIVFANGKFQFAPDFSLIPVLSLIAGITEIFSVVADADGLISNYFWGIINNIAYIWVSYDSHLYGEVYLNLLFLVTQFIGIYLWYSKNEMAGAKNVNTVQVKQMSGTGWIFLLIFTVIAWLLMAMFLMHVPFLSATLDPHPWLDALSTVTNVVAQFLLITRYGTPQFIMWIIGNGIETILWVVNFNPIVAMFWLLCTINAFYGWYVWEKKLSHQS